MSKKNTTNQSNPLRGKRCDTAPPLMSLNSSTGEIKLVGGFEAPLSQLKEFHEAFDLAAFSVPCIPLGSTPMLRTKLMVSECSETVEAMADEDMLEILDGLVDQLYVVLGTAVSYGLADILPAAFQLVHDNNMSKLGPDGKPIKVIKKPRNSCRM